MSITELYIEEREINLMIDLHTQRMESWQALSRLADNKEVAKVCLDHAYAHALYRSQFTAKLIDVRSGE